MLYKDKRDKWDVRYLGIWFFMGNISNFIFEFFEKENPLIKNSIIRTSIIVVILILITPFVLHIYSGPLEKRMINLSYRFKTIYGIIGITMFTICIVYIVYSFYKLKF